MTEPASSDPKASADALLDALVAGLPPQDAVQALAQVAHRSAVRLHTLARAEAAARKGQPSWPLWAQLQNAGRAMLLQASTCRDFAARLGSGSARES